MDICRVIAEELNVKVPQVEAAVSLLDDGCTVPFIARYRKEKTGSMNDEQLRSLHERLTYLRNLEERKASVLAAIEEQGRLTDDLRRKIEEVAFWWSWRICTAPTSPRERPEPPWHGRRGWKAWPPC